MVQCTPVDNAQNERQAVYRERKGSPGVLGLAGPKLLFIHFVVVVDDSVGNATLPRNTVCCILEIQYLLLLQCFVCLFDLIKSHQQSFS